MTRRLRRKLIYQLRSSRLRLMILEVRIRMKLRWKARRLASSHWAPHQLQMYPQGRISHHFREMRLGDHRPVKGPKVHLIYANVTYEDILLKPPEIWEDGVGFIICIKGNVSSLWHAPASHLQVLRCGPPPTR